MLVRRRSDGDARWQSEAKAIIACSNARVMYGPVDARWVSHRCSRSRWSSSARTAGVASGGEVVQVLDFY